MLIIPAKHLNQFHFSFVQNYLNYANLAWGSTQKTVLSTLYRQQKHSIRLLSLKNGLHTPVLFLKKFNSTLNIYEVNIFNILCLMLKCKNKACPKAFENLYNIKPKIKYQLKRSYALLEPFCKTKFSQLCKDYRNPHLWNTIVLSQNTDFEESATLKVFKEKT